MAVNWTRARHPELGDAVLPLDAMESYPEWEAVGEPSTDVAALRAELEREQLAAELAAKTEPPPPAPRAPAPTKPNPDPEPPAPSGADPKE